MIARSLFAQIEEALAYEPAVALLGPRQVGKTTLAIEIGTPKLERGFHHACADLNPARKFVVYPGSETWRMAEDIEVISLSSLATLIRGTG